MKPSKTLQQTRPPPNAVEQVFRTYPPPIRDKLYSLRDQILAVADANPAVGPLTETLKWGEPAYLTEATKAGSTIRIGRPKSAPSSYAIYFNCNTNLVDTFRTLFPELRFSGNRALLFEEHEDPPMSDVRACIELALTYHLRKRKRR